MGLHGWVIIWNFQVDAQLSPTYNSDIRLYTHKPSFYAYKALAMPLQRKLQVLCEALEHEPIHAMLEQQAEKGLIRIGYRVFAPAHPLV